MLLAARDPENPSAPGMSDEQIRDEAMTIFLAGHETTANAMAWTWHLLGKSRPVEERLHEELARVLDGRTPGVEDVPKLEYTRAVVAESMRLYPPAWTMGRKAIDTHTIDGHTIDPGSLVIVSQWIAHHDPRWWYEADRFRPIDGSTRRRRFPRRHAPKYSYFPFGGGSRICIGESFAWTEAILLLATIAQRWRFVAGRAPDARAAHHAPTERSPYAGRCGDRSPVRLRSPAARSAPSPRAAGCTAAATDPRRPLRTHGTRSRTTSGVPINPDRSRGSTPSSPRARRAARAACSRSTADSCRSPPTTA
jgi:cytochrome P450